MTKVFMKDFADKKDYTHNQFNKMKLIRIMDTVTNFLIMFTLAFAIYVAIKY